VWDATGSFQLDAEIAHTYGSVYSLAVTKKYVIVGRYYWAEDLYILKEIISSIGRLDQT
jgi:hypothetical protein